MEVITLLFEPWAHFASVPVKSPIASIPPVILSEARMLLLGAIFASE